MSDRWTWHGGGLAAARARFGDAHAPWIDLSTGINPDPWPLPDLPIDWRRLPDERDLAALEAAAAAHFGTSAAYVCAVPGTEIGLRLAGRLLGGPAFHLGPGYRTHAEMFDQAMPIAIDRIEAADGATLVIANPNNPDGRRLDRDAIAALIERRGDGWLIVDEAFADADPGMSVAGDVRADRRLLVFRSFGKFFGLAGVRLGFVIGPPAVLARLRALLGAWPVSAAAIAIGTAAYRDRAWIEAAGLRLRDRAAVLDALLEEAGLRSIGHCPLFRMVEVADAHLLFQRLAARAILTRPFADDPHRLRIGLPADDDAAQRLAAALGGG